MVERQLPKLKVAGSIPVARSTFLEQLPTYDNAFLPEAAPVVYRLEAAGAARWRQMTPKARPTLANLSMAKSRSSLVCTAEIITRMRAFPLGTVG